MSTTEKTYIDKRSVAYNWTTVCLSYTWVLLPGKEKGPRRSGALWASKMLLIVSVEVRISGRRVRPRWRTARQSKIAEHDTWTWQSPMSCHLRNAERRERKNCHILLADAETERRAYPVHITVRLKVLLVKLYCPHAKQTKRPWL